MADPVAPIELDLRGAARGRYEKLHRQKVMIERAAVAASVDRFAAAVGVVEEGDDEGEVELSDEAMEVFAEE